MIEYLCVQTGSPSLTEVGKGFKRDVATIKKGVRRMEQGVEEKINGIHKGQVVKGNKPSLFLTPRSGDRNCFGLPSLECNPRKSGPITRPPGARIKFGV